MALAGRIGWSRARLEVEGSEGLILRWRRKQFALRSCVVRHYDDEGHVRFVVSDGSRDVEAEYRRRGPRFRDQLADYVDFTGYEPWTWEDRDFGLRTFHVATGTGPVKHRHRLAPSPAQLAGVAGRAELAIDDAGVRRTRDPARTEQVLFRDLCAVRAKFEVAGIWAEPTLIVLHGGDDLVVVPVGSDADVSRCRGELLPRLRRLPGWDAAADAALADALDYARRDPIGPTRDEQLDSRAERGIWAAA